MERIDAKVFGATSFMGAFSPEGFVDGAVLLAEDGDDIKASYRLVETTENNARERARCYTYARNAWVRGEDT